MPENSVSPMSRLKIIAMTTPTPTMVTLRNQAYFNRFKIVIFFLFQLLIERTAICILFRMHASYMVCWHTIWDAFWCILYKMLLCPVFAFLQKCLRYLLLKFSPTNQTRKTLGDVGKLCKLFTTISLTSLQCRHQTNGENRSGVNSHPETAEHERTLKYARAVDESRSYVWEELQRWCGRRDMRISG